LPGVPGACGQWMGWRSDAHQVHQRKLAVLLVARDEEAGLGHPAVGEQVGMAVAHPLVIDTFPDFAGESRHFGLFAEALRGCERARVKPSTVADGDLALRAIELASGGRPERSGIEAGAGALTLLDVEPVIEPAVLLGRVIGVVAEGVEGALAELFARHPVV